ncbi:MAG: glycosyltransferase family 2 protein [Coriobacteriales bacterium]|jgi:glycosyltransferase involved in cell wall biosynthesis|nr:glycosyltransferase family 2 protein [Coriobacteriales bacterium]
MADNTTKELTILMPCLDEAETLAICIDKAQRFLEESGVNGEVLIADNGSTDGSQQIARDCGARVVDVPVKGYGAALIGGTQAALGTYIIMGDADDSYDFSNLMPFVEKLRDGYDLVMGNRFKGGIAKGAMPPLHKYLGNPVLSFLGRLFFKSDIGDFHCGLRGYNRERFLALKLHTTGMEYASEMVVQATLREYRIAEVPTTLKKDGRSRPPHLRSWRDGWRHLKFLLMYSPNWLFLYPGITAIALGLLFTVILEIGAVTVSSVTFDINTLLYTTALVIAGINLVLFSAYTRVYAVQNGFIKPKLGMIEKIDTERGIIIGVLLLLTGLVITVIAVILWAQDGFGNLDPRGMMRLTIPGIGLIISGLQIVSAGFFMDILKIRTKSDIE